MTMVEVKSVMQKDGSLIVFCANQILRYEPAGIWNQFPVNIGVDWGYSPLNRLLNLLEDLL